MDEEQVPLSIKAQKITISTKHYEAIVDMLNKNKAPFQLVGENEYMTVVNAVTMQSQADFIRNFILMMDKIRSGDQSLL